MTFNVKIAILSVAIFYVVIIIEVTDMFEKFAEDVVRRYQEKLAALETLQHFTKSGPKNRISKSVSQWHTENPAEAEAFIFDLYNKLGWKHNNPAKYMKTRHEIEDWMYNQLPNLNVQAKTKFPIYSAMDLGYIPEVFKDMKSHLEIPVKGLENRLTFTMGDSIPVLSRVPVEDRKLYNLSDIHNMGLDEVIKRVKASTSNSRGQDYLEAQLWITPEEAQQMAKFINNSR